MCCLCPSFRGRTSVCTEFIFDVLQFHVLGLQDIRAIAKKPLTFANQGLSYGAGEMNRTPDLLITNELLYRLSYTGVSP